MSQPLAGRLVLLFLGVLAVASILPNGSANACFLLQQLGAISKAGLSSRLSPL